MATIVAGERVGKGSRLSTGCSAVIFDEARQKVLLTRRSDNGRWCLPGGAMDAGESAEEACAREVWEETGLRVHVGKLIGVYSSPHRIIVYNDGNRVQVVGLCFEATPIAGDLGLSDETTEAGYYTLDEIATMDIMEPNRERIHDAFAAQPEAFVR